MRVLVSNDDGVEARGIEVLAKTLSAVGEVVVVAPDRDRSGASNSLTLDQPIRVTRLGDNRYRVAGTRPTAYTSRCAACSIGIPTLSSRASTTRATSETT